MRYLSVEEILAIHDESIEKDGGAFGVREMGFLHSLVERPKMAVFGQEFYPDMLTKAAATLEAMATYHVFADGNKRTAFMATATFLELNGFMMEVPSHAALRFILAVATKKKSIPQIASWLKRYTKKKRRPSR